MTTRFHSVLVLALATAGFAAPALAQSTHTMPGGMVMSGNTMDKPADTAAVNMAMGEATVKKINKTKGTVTLAHGALPNGMPPMTMAYKVKDATWLDKMTIGQKIRFATDPADGMTVSSFEATK